MEGYSSGEVPQAAENAAAVKDITFLTVTFLYFVSLATCGFAVSQLRWQPDAQHCRCFDNHDFRNSHLHNAVEKHPMAIKNGYAGQLTIINRSMFVNVVSMDIEFPAQEAEGEEEAVSEEKRLAVMSS